MKRLVFLSVLMTAFAMNAVAYEHKIVERHNFRLMHPEDYSFESATIHWNDNRIDYIEQKNSWSSITTKASYKSWLYGDNRFLCEPGDNLTADLLDLSNVIVNAMPVGWKCEQTSSDPTVHEYGTDNTYSSGPRVFTDFQNGGKALFWREVSAEYGSQDNYPLALFKGSYSLTFAMAKRDGNADDYTLQIVNKATNEVVKQESYTPPSVISPNHSSVDLSGISTNTLQFDISEAGNYIIRFTTNSTSQSGYILASCQLTRIGGCWQITKTARTDKGYGLVNVSGINRGLKILNLKAGDVVRFEYYRNSDKVPMPTFKVTQGCIRGRHQSYSTANVEDIVNDKPINGNYDIFVDSDGDLDINCPSGILIREVRISLAEYKAASFEIDEVDGGNGSVGYKFTLTGSGVLETKHPAIPYITMAFGNDDDMTIVKNFGNSTSHSVTQHNNLEHGGYSGYKVKPSGQTEPQNPQIIPEEGTDNHVVSVHCDANESQGWNAQFWVVLPKGFPEGSTVNIKLKYKADNETDQNISLQGHGAPGDYRNNLDVEALHFTTEWQPADFTITVPADGSQNHTAGDMKSIAFNLADCKLDNNYYFDDLVISYDETHNPNDPTDLEGKCFAASCIVDESHNLNITDANVSLTANYKKRYQNESGQFVAFPDHLSNNQIHDSWYQSVGVGDADAEEQARVAALAQEEVNTLKGREWSVFKSDNYWNSEINESVWATQRSRSYRWSDDFHTIWPQYGTYFYFFPDVKGKLSVKFYCEGVGENIPFWWKAQDGEPIDVCVTNPNDNDGDNNCGKIYEYKDIDVVAGGAYYLCANPTLITREHPVVRLISYTFIPEFRVAPLWQVVDNGTTSLNQACTIYGGPFSDLSVDKGRLVSRNGEDAPEVKFLGNIEDATFTITSDGDKQYLNISGIKYKGDFEGSQYPSNSNVNKGGAIVVNLHCQASTGTNISKNLITYVLTVAYKASDAKWGTDGNGKPARVGTTTEVKRWDFFTDELAVGQYKDNNGEQYRYPSNEWKQSSTLFKEVYKYDNLTTDWEDSYADRQTPGKERIFRSVYDLDGDNADMLDETEGLIIHSETNLLGIYNENDASNSEFRDRYIGFMGQGDWDYVEHPRQLIIPFLKQNDRVVIKMGTYGNADSTIPTEEAVLKFTNALDAKGNTISGDYVIGGSLPYPDETVAAKAQPHGEYHFRVANDGHFILEVKDAKLLKIYSIVIYRNAANNNADILTENSITTANGPEMLITNESSKDMEFYLRYSGYGEPITFSEFDNSYTRGNLELTGSSFSAGSKANSLKATFAQGKFGSFRRDATVKTKDNNSTYVTDYTPGYLAVGYRETKTYPYTWDFTDLKKYVTTKENNVVTEGIDDGNGNEKNAAANAPKMWDNWNMVVAPDDFYGNIFASGGQLYAGTKMFDETRGLGIVHNGANNVMTMTSEVENSVDTKDNGGLAIGDGDYGFVVPRVGKDNAVYVHAKPVSGVTPLAAFAIGDASETTFGTENTQSYAGNDTVNTGHKVFAMLMTNNDSTDVKLHFKGYEVTKIAVSNAPKAVNVKGWTSESRDTIIDPALTAYMTGKDIRTYVVTDVNYPTKYVELTRIDNENYLMPKAIDGDNNACVILNFKKKDENGIEGKQANILNNGFHLFVPDMHETKTAYNGTSRMVSQVSPKSGNNKIPETITIDNVVYTNYAFTCQYYDVNPYTGEKINDSDEAKNGIQAFYRFIAGGANSKGNQGYLPINLASTGGGSNTRFTIMMVDNGASTGIATLQQGIDTYGAENRYFNLNGQQLSGKPNRSGLYIVNGKKVFVKNR